MTDMWDKNKIIHLLETNDIAIARALVRLNAEQTTDEQIQQQTKYKNNRGFRPCHARMGHIMAKYYLDKGNFSQKQANYWRVRDKNGVMRIAIYANQLLNMVK